MRFSVGHSLGGQNAVHCAVRFPDRVRSGNPRVRPVGVGGRLEHERRSDGDPRVSQDLLDLKDVSPALQEAQSAGVTKPLAASRTRYNISLWSVLISSRISPRPAGRR
jgi:pimeloyl-ACP methyl ester carboxylesterase